MWALLGADEERLSGRVGNRLSWVRQERVWRGVGSFCVNLRGKKKKTEVIPLCLSSVMNEELGVW